MKIRVCEISHFFFYEGYRKKAAEVSTLLNEPELLIAPRSWVEDHHQTKSEQSRSDEYIIRERRASLNWKLWGGKRYQLFMLSPRIIIDMLSYKPTFICVDSEPYGLLAFEVAVFRRIFFRKSRLIVHSSQNIHKEYPFPFRLTERFVMSQASAVFSRTEEIRQVLLSKGCKCPVYVISHGVDIYQFSPRDQAASLPSPAAKEPLKIGYVGSIVEQKGLNVLVDAVALIQAPFDLQIVGNGPLKASLEERIRNSSLKSRVSFSPSVQNSELPKILRRFDVLVIPSLTTPGWKEQFGRIIIEAMACGVPVIGSDSGSIPEVIGDGGVIVHENDPSQLCAALEEVARDRNSLRELSLKARKRAVENFSWGEVAKRIVSTYRQILNV